MYKLFLTLRYLRSRLIAYFAIAAVALCAAMVLIVMSVMGGFLDNVKLRARSLLGDVIIDNRDINGFPLYAEFIEQVREWPEVIEATPVVYTWGLYRFPEWQSAGMVRVVGVRLTEVYEVNGFHEGLYYEKLYPGTTDLAAQQQPLLGVGWRTSADGTEYVPEVRLPEPYASARAKAEAAGIRDEVGAPPDPELLKEVNLPPGRFAAEFAAPPNSTPPGQRGEEWPGIIFGRDIVALRTADARYDHLYEKGELVTLTMLQVNPDMTVDQPLKQPFRYVDDLRTGIYEIDSRHVYADFDLLQRLLRMEAEPRADGEGVFHARCSQIQMKIDQQRVSTSAARRALCQRLEAFYRALPETVDPNIHPFDQRLIDKVDVMTWEQSQEHIIAPVEKERALVTILFAIISMVAAVLTMCILYMIVLQKTRDIGIVKALGGSSAGVALIFVFYGAAIGVVGAILGLIGGYYFVSYINEIEGLLVSLNPAWRVWDRSVYSFDEIPSTVRTADLITVGVFAVLSSTVGSLLAAWRAGAMNPLEALRYE